MKLLDLIFYRIRHGISDSYYNVKNFLINVYVFRELLWKFRNWDSHWSLYSFSFTLKILSKAIHEDKLHVYTKKEKQQLRAVIDALDQYMEYEDSMDDNDDPIKRTDDIFKIPTEYREIKFNFDDTRSQSTLVDLRDKYLNEQQKIRYQKEKLNQYKLKNIRQKARLMYAFETFTKKHRRWWT